MSLSSVRRDREHGAALALTLIAITALLGLGAFTVLSVRSELVSSGQARFSQAALYAAESGNAAAMEFLRSSCSTQTLFTQWISPANAAPQTPEGILGNDKRPGMGGNPFIVGSDIWYSVSILNNANDPGYAAGTDTDGTVVLHAVGYGPDQTVAVVELEVKNDVCLGQFCAQTYAQRGMSAKNDSNSACSAQLSTGNLRALTP